MYPKAKAEAYRPRSGRAILSPRAQRGSALMMGVFILVVMTLLGTAMLRILTSSNETIAFEVVGTRAYSAAQIGLQWRLQQIFTLGPTTYHCDSTLVADSPDDHASTDTSLPPVSFTIGDAPGLQNCKVSALSCEDFKVDGVTYYTVKSTGQCSLAGEVTTRTVEVQARSLQ